MKLLLTALLCLLLTGCSVPTQSPPLETVPISRESTDHLHRQYRNEVEAVSLPLRDIRYIKVWNDCVLLQSGKTLMLLDDAFQPAASCTLDFIPEVSASGSTLCAFDADSRQLLLLDSSLKEFQRLPLPQDLSGSPVYAENTVYYCTHSGIYCWDLESGIRHCIRDTAYENQRLVGIHWDNTVLQCRIREDHPQDLFLDTQTGQLLQQLDTAAQLDTVQKRYYCTFSSGATEMLLFSDDSGANMEFLPETSTAQKFFLPEIHMAVTLDESGLACYDLQTGLLRDTLALYHTPKAILGRKDSILLLISDNDQDVLLLWEPQPTLSGESPCTHIRYTADKPDLEGLRQCRETAATLSDAFGLEVLIWKDAAAVSPWDYAFTPEYRTPAVQEQLQLVNRCLSRYPKTVLSQTASHFASVKLCLVQTITGTASEYSLSTATGLQFLNGADAHVALAAGPYMEQALYHELFHVMETHILGNSNALDRWEALNPAGFSYDLDHGANARRNSGVYLEGSQRAFVDTYSMSFPKEDRARIFEYAMLPDMAGVFRSSIMQSKLSAICTGIREAYHLKDPDFPLPWEQYLQ